MKFLQNVLKYAPRVKYYAQLAIYFVDMLDGVQDFNQGFKPADKKAK